MPRLRFPELEPRVGIIEGRPDDFLGVGALAGTSSSLSVSDTSIAPEDFGAGAVGVVVVTLLGLLSFFRKAGCADRQRFG